MFFFYYYLYGNELEKKIISEELDFIDSYEISSLTYNECFFFYYYLYGNELEKK